MDVAAFINQYGFPIASVFGLGYFIFYIWKWTTNELKPVVKETETTLVGLIDRIRMLDNDLIRLEQKVNVVLQMRGRTKNS